MTGITAAPRRPLIATGVCRLLVISGSLAIERRQAVRSVSRLWSRRALKTEPGAKRRGAIQQIVGKQ
jgi:hypothetical protein